MVDGGIVVSVVIDDTVFLVDDLSEISSFQSGLQVHAVGPIAWFEVVVISD